MREALQKVWKNKAVRIAVLCVLALLLLLLIRETFFVSKEETICPQTELERKLGGLLSGIEGVGNVTVMITEEEGVPVGAVIVFEGADSILSRMRVLDVASSVLNIEKERVKVYPA